MGSYCSPDPTEPESYKVYVDNYSEYNFWDHIQSFEVEKIVPSEIKDGEYLCIFHYGWEGFYHPTELEQQGTIRRFKNSIELYLSKDKQLVVTMWLDQSYSYDDISFRVSCYAEKNSGGMIL